MIDQMSSDCFGTAHGESKPLQSTRNDTEQNMRLESHDACIEGGPHFKELFIVSINTNC